MRTVFFGASSVAVPSLEALAGSAHKPLLVVTQPDRPAGRGRRVSPSAVKLAALEHNLPVFQPDNPHSEEAVGRLGELAPELFVVIAYGLIFKRRLLELPSKECINVHLSLLPRYRGPAPVQWAILNDDKETGVTVIRMVPGVDAGPILGQRSVEILPRETAGDLCERLGVTAGELLIEVAGNIESGTVTAKQQDESQASSAPAFRKADGEINWSHSAWYICNHIRAMTPWPSAYTFLQGKREGGLRVTMLEAHVVGSPSGGAPPGEVIAVENGQIVVAAGEEAVCVDRLMAAGGRAMGAADFIRGRRAEKGDKFGSLQQSLRFPE